MVDLHCPACKKPLTSPKALPKHTNGCSKWGEVIGGRPGDFNFDAYFKRGLYADGLEEGKDYLVCRLCAELGKQWRKTVLSHHLRVEHGLSSEDYLAKYPGAKVVLEAVGEKRKATSREKYGTEFACQSKEVKDRIKETSLERYGTASPMQNPEIRARSEAAVEAKYGVKNPFHSAEIQAKAKRSMVEKYGTAHPMQVEKIRKRAEQTNTERYGASMFLQGDSWKAVLVGKRKEREEARRVGLIAGGKYEICPHCEEIFEMISSSHKAICEGWPPGPEVEPCLCGHEASSLTVMKLHRRFCQVWLTRDAEAVAKERARRTNLKRYGVEHAMQSPIIQAKVERTNMLRHGAPRFGGNPFRRPKGTPAFYRHEINPFSRLEVKEKIRQTNLLKYGFENAAQSPDVKERTKQTVRERYGVDHALAAPEIRRRIEETNLRKYGSRSPASSEEVKAKIRETNLERWGQESTANHPEVRRKQLEAMEARWGSHFFASSEGKEKARLGMRAKYGVDYYPQVEGYWERQVKHFLDKFGVEHPLQLVEFLEKRRHTCQRIYGVDSPLQNPEVMAKVVATCLDRYGASHAVSTPPVLEKTIRTCLAKVGKTFPEYAEEAKTEENLIARYGVSHPQEDRDYASFFLNQMAGSSGQFGPNGLERRFHKTNPEFMYTGDRTFWRWLPKLGHHKNPDFILPGPDPEHPRRDVTHCLEMFGDYWHSKIFTGKANFEHEQELIEAYAEVGLKCLVIWEGEFNTDPAGVRERVLDFLGGSAVSSEHVQLKGSQPD